MTGDATKSRVLSGAYATSSINGQSLSVFVAYDVLSRCNSVAFIPERGHNELYFDCPNEFDLPDSTVIERSEPS